jgi:hypothetical protein
MTDYAPRTRECLAAVVSSAGKHFQVDEGLKPLSNSPDEGPEDGKLAVFSYLGDVLLRFVFTAPGCLQAPLRQDDMKRLDLTPERALVIATVNIKRMQGAPQVGVLTEGVYSLRGSNPDESSAYLLDRAFWRSQLLKSEPGVIVAMPKRGSLFFAYAGDANACQELKRLAARLFHAADEHGLSGCLFRFDAKGWQVHERLPTAPVQAQQGAAPRLKDAELRDKSVDAQRLAQRDEEREVEDEEEKLALAASGQKMVIYSILLNFVLRAVERSNEFPQWLLVILSICVGIYSLVGVVKLCSGLGKGQGLKIFFMVASFFPFANLLSLIYLSRLATKALRAAGWSIGLLGARP